MGMSKVAEAVTSWYDEVKTPGYDPEGVEKYVFDSATGHYAQVIWAETDQIGCGAMWFATTQKQETTLASQCTRWGLHAQSVQRAPVVMLTGSVLLLNLKSIIIGVSNKNSLKLAFPSPRK